MNPRKPFSRFLLLTAAALGAGAGIAAPATADSLAFGAAGEVYRLRQGAAGELFGATAADPAAPAMALEKTLADGTTSRLAIPGTDDARSEEQPGLLFDEGSRTLVLHWLSRGEGGAYFRFASYDGELSPVGTVETRTAQNAATPILFAADPQLASSRDAFAIQLMGGQVIVAHRTILHLAWREGGRARYAPVMFVEGQWVGWSEALDLSGIVRSRHDLTALTPLTGPFAEYLALRTDEARRAAAITLTDGPSGRLSEIEVRYQPMTLEQVGERVRNRFFRLITLYKPSEDLDDAAGGASFQIVGLGQQGLGTETLTALVDGLQRGLIQLDGLSCGADAAPENVYLGIAGIGKDGMLGLPSTITGDMLHVALLGDNPDQLEAIIGGAGFTIVGLGSVGCAVQGDSQSLIQLGQGGEILHVSLTGKPIALEAGNGELFGTNNGQREALVATSALWLRAEAAAPAAAGAKAEVMIGPSTGEFLVAWADGEQLRYSRTERSVWREAATVALSEEMTLELALDLLRKNLR